jgi:hypothetical protein
MTANEILEQIESSGGAIALYGERLRYKLPATAASLLDALRNHRDAIVELLRERDSPPVMPTGVRLIRWQPKEAPIILTRWSVVTDTTKFIHETLRQLDAALAGRSPCTSCVSGSRETTSGTI